MPIPEFRTTKEGIQYLYLRVETFLETREETCPIKEEFLHRFDDVIKKIDEANNVHREEKYKELEKKIESQEKAEERRKAFWKKFWTGIAAAVIISVVVNYVMPKLWPKSETKTEKIEEKEK